MVSEQHIDPVQLISITAPALVITEIGVTAKRSHTELSDAGAAVSHETPHRALQ